MLHWLPAGVSRQTLSMHSFLLLMLLGWPDCSMHCCIAHLFLQD
jgi:hypothetical protein